MGQEVYELLEWVSFTTRKLGRSILDGLVQEVVNGFGLKFFNLQWKASGVISRGV